MIIHNNIRKYREQNKLTQDDLARAVSVSRQTIVAMEKGNYEPSLGLALKLARYFNERIEHLFDLQWY